MILQSTTGEAGTLGMVVTSDGLDRWLLTCHHVLARRDLSLVQGDMVLQPDATNGPIATLGTARADSGRDCAAAQLTVPASDVILGLGSPVAFRPPVVGMNVIKSGWKTGVSEGRIQRVLGDEVIIERRPGYPVTYVLATIGDSGSVWLEATTLAPIALHTRESAVGPHLAFGTHFGSVVRSLALRQV